MALAFAVDGANVSIGIQKKEIHQILDRKFLYPKFAEHDASLQGAVGQTIQFTAQFPPQALLGGFNDVANLPKRDPIQRQRTITPLTYGDSREWTTEYVKRSQANVERALREELPNTVAREVNAACGAQLRTTNCLYVPTGAAGAETFTVEYDGATAVVATRNISVWDLPQFISTAIQLGIPPDPSYGWAYIMHPAAAPVFLRSVQAVAQFTTEGWKQMNARFEAGTYVGKLYGVECFVDNSGDVLGLTAANAVGEGLFFGYKPLVEASVEQTVQTGTQVHDVGRKITFGMWRTAVGWALKVNDLGAGVVPPAVRGSQCAILVTGA